MPVRCEAQGMWADDVTGDAKESCNTWRERRRPEVRSA